MKGKATKNGCKKRVKGGTSSLFVCPLQGQGAELPCGVWGNAPTVFRALSSKGTVNKGAGSEASLPVAKKPSKYSSSNMGGDRRRSPEGDRKALWNYANDQFDRKINSGYSKKLTFFILAGDFASAEATKGLSDRPLETFGSPLPELTFIGARELAPMEATNINSGVSGAFSPNTPHYSYASFSTVIFPSVTFSRTRSPSAILPPSSSSLSVSSTVR